MKPSSFIWAAVGIVLLNVLLWGALLAGGVWLIVYMLRATGVIQ